jgi:hypothetical protein
VVEDCTAVTIGIYCVYFLFGSVESRAALIRWGFHLGGETEEGGKRVQQLRKLGREVLMFLILVHLGEYPGVCECLGVGHGLGREEFEQVRLQEVEEAGDELVVVGLILARGKSAIYRHFIITRINHQFPQHFFFSPDAGFSMLMLLEPSPSFFTGDDSFCFFPRFMPYD